MWDGLWSYTGQPLDLLEDGQPPDPRGTGGDQLVGLASLLSSFSTEDQSLHHQPLRLPQTFLSLRLNLNSGLESSLVSEVKSPLSESHHDPVCWRLNLQDCSRVSLLRT